MDRLEAARKVFNTEIIALEAVRDSLDSTFLRILDVIVECQGRLIITGMGKSGHIARKVSATLSSLGSPAYYVNPAEAMHGDLGMVTNQDVLIAFSYSGETREIVELLPSVKLIGASIIGITGNKESTLAKCADIAQVLPEMKEACHLGLAPTSSTTAELVYGDALAVVISQISGFTKSEFGKYHPLGTLGKKILLCVKDIMAKGERNAVVVENTHLMDSIIEMSNKGLGMVSVTDDNGDLKGILTSGDVRRLLEKHINVYSVNTSEVMQNNPLCFHPEDLAIDALHKMVENDFMVAPVVFENKAVGTIMMKEIVREGLI